jgi:hypothetical protein
LLHARDCEDNECIRQYITALSARPNPSGERPDPSQLALTGVQLNDQLLVDHRLHFVARGDA